jgi:hypothetical protein
LAGGTYTTIDFPGAASTGEPSAMNDAGVIAGGYTDASGVGHGFLGRPAAVDNGLVHLSSTHTSFNATPVPGGPAGTYTIVTTFKNSSSTPIDTPQFVVTTLSNGNLLLDADLPPGTVGSRLTGHAGSDGILSPGESLTASFVIGLQQRKAFTFFVNLLGVSSP